MSGARPAAAGSPVDPVAPPVADAAPGYNLIGQRLGRKGRDTRERILAATQQLLAEPGEAPISLSAVARRASLGMTTLYLYFSDLTELLLAMLEPVMASADDFYLAHLRERWPDATLENECIRFVEGFHAFWRENARVLHLRNSYADANDERMYAHRIASSLPLIELLVRQMDADPTDRLSATYGMAGLLHIAIERNATVTTQAGMRLAWDDGGRDVRIRHRVAAGARLLELGVRDCRTAATARVAG